MCEVTKENFAAKLPEIKESLNKCKFVSIDLEYSGLNPVRKDVPSVFDNNAERYAKLRDNLLQVIPIQFGISIFHFNNHRNDYDVEVFTFYLAPPAFGNVDKSFYFQASTMRFLCLYKMDFNKFAYSGIPYLRLEDEIDLPLAIERFELFETNYEFIDAAQLFLPKIYKWYRNPNINTPLQLPEITVKYKDFPEFKYYFHQFFRFTFDHVWTYEEDGSFFLKKITNQAEWSLLHKNCKLSTEFISYLNGFSDVISTLMLLRKPLIGHNLLQDLMIICNSFRSPLPESYHRFKKIINFTLPAIFDTKTIFYELRKQLPKRQMPNDTSLGGLFKYFKSGFGKKLCGNCPEIRCNIAVQDFDNYHNAGWDSFCAGYVFICLGHFNISRFYPQLKEIVFTEMIGKLKPYKNCINIIRGSTNYIRLDGPDPDHVSKGPPWMVIESWDMDIINMNEVMFILKSFGFVDVKLLNWRQALVAADTEETAHKIFQHFQNHPKYYIKPFSSKRSPITLICIVGVVITSIVALFKFMNGKK